MTESVVITWWGHSTTTIALGGRRILTDPVLTGRVAHLRRIAGPVPTGEARSADAAIVSHLHLDHLHVPSLRLLSAGTRIVAPNGAGRVIRSTAPGLARRVEEVGPGDIVDLGGVRLRAVPAEHDGRRWPMSGLGPPALGYVLETGGDAHDDVGRQRVWFAGDTGLFAGMGELGPLDVAIVPVGGWGPGLGPTHLDPVQAAEAVRRSGACDAVPIHYGTLWPAGLRIVQPASFRRYFADPGTRFASELAAVCPDSRAHVLGHGQTATIPRRAS
jgi:L-ascorbate metabolism protein UlaG (beta-lactamase superfamily)